MHERGREKQRMCPCESTGVTRGSETICGAEHNQAQDMVEAEGAIDLTDVPATTLVLLFIASHVASITDHESRARQVGSQVGSRRCAYAEGR